MGLSPDPASVAREMFCAFVLFALDMIFSRRTWGPQRLNPPVVTPEVGYLNGVRTKFSEIASEKMFCPFSRDIMSLDGIKGYGSAPLATSLVTVALWVV